MSNAGYGNHDGSKPGSAVGETPDPGAAAAKPDTGSADRPGRDSGSGEGTSCAKGSTAETRSDEDRREVATPGDGAGVGRDQAGSDVDPGVG